MSYSKQVLIVKIGSDDHPAGPKDVENVQKSLEQVAKDPSITIITHNSFEFLDVGIPDKKSDYALIVKMGSCERPAESEDIEAMQTLMSQAEGADGDATIVTHHAVEVRYMPRSGLKNIFVLKTNGEPNAKG